MVAPKVAEKLATPEPTPQRFTWVSTFSGMVAALEGR